MAMDLERVRAVCAYYRDSIHDLDNPRGAPTLRVVVGRRQVRRAAVRHLASMLPRLDTLIDEGRREKAMRWYGFIQGALWALGFFTVDELKEHSRPDAPLPTWGEP